MIVTAGELRMIRRGRPWLTLGHDPGWRPGRVVRLRERHRNGRRSKDFTITVREVVRDGEYYRVLLTPGDTRDREVYLAEGWPDYTADSQRAMKDELPPMSEDMESTKARLEWTGAALVALHGRSRKRRKDSSRQRERGVVHEAGSLEAIATLRRLTAKTVTPDKE